MTSQHYRRLTGLLISSGCIVENLSCFRSDVRLIPIEEDNERTNRLRRWGRHERRVGILRAPGIYAQDRFPADRVRKALPAIVAEDDAYTNHIHADDLARLALAVLFRGRPNRVYNAVDDHLSGPDQLHQRWALEDLRLLLPILREAREARRVVVVTADHGHLLEDGTTPVDASRGGEAAEPGDRWRPGTKALSAREMVATSGRVVTADEEPIALEG